MAHFEQAIKLAEEAGYKATWYLPSEKLLDPLFWKFLVKGLNFEEYVTRIDFLRPDWLGYEDKVCTCALGKETRLVLSLMCHELNLTGGNLEEYWQNLISKK